MITDQISRVFDRLPYIRLYFCNFPFIFYISRHTFVSKLGTMNLLMLKLSSGETIAGSKCWHRNPFFFKWKPNRFPIFRSFTTIKCWHKKPLFEWKPSTNSICKQIQSDYLLNTYNHHPGDHPLVSDGSADLSILVFSPIKEGRAEEWPENQSRTRT